MYLRIGLPVGKGDFDNPVHHNEYAASIVSLLEVSLEQVYAATVA
jgi:hypothetical protein